MMRNDEDDPEKCRERRRRRIKMRRCLVVSAAGSPPEKASINLIEDRTESSNFVEEGKLVGSEKASDHSLTSSSSGEDVDASYAAATNCISVSEVVPVFGSMSLSGRQRDMEDAICVRTNLCRPEVNRRRPVHFFGVYDGHGGPHVAAMCRDKMHVLMEEELMRVEYTPVNESGGSGPQVLEDDCWRRAMRRCFERMDEVAMTTCVCGSMGNQCGCHTWDMALTGSTALVAVVTAEQIVVANCGDSRAVLSRAGRPIPLSFDQKPDRADEEARIKASGGHVIFFDGARVEGILAMSRAIGDRYLKPIVTAEPEITFTKRVPEDDCLILASDGMWDVLSSELACDIASECLQEGSSDAASSTESGAGDLYPSRSQSAAALLTRLALGRKTFDNVSVIVVDLKEELKAMIV
ncbi:unnamed protein product [Ilex paraguariensis]|uniref:protein-serine/threonine phosphatase n=1 Tax=Ilex paraguariensis TaxID=185542 RepID=A0ABC8QR63_9AQUA